MPVAIRAGALSRRSLPLALAMLVGGLPAGCILSPLDLEGRSCPCVEGWRCDVPRNVCVRGCTTVTDCHGTESCVGGLCLSIDAGPPCTPDPETCDGGDDDCDGRIDEGSGLCSLPSAMASCRSGACAVDGCQPGWDDCDSRAENGCETPLGTVDDCGACDEACRGATPFCAPGAGGALACAASCPSTLTECSGACVDLDTSLAHCGACDDRCAPAHATGVCRTGVCSVGVCDSRWSNCDGDVETGCEASLDSAETCGSCTNDCTGGATGTCTTGRCIGGSCMTVAAGAGEVCRRAVSLCDTEELCDAAGNCPPDRFAMAGVACRMSTCGGLDPRELCTGTSGECPPPCGCEGEPCCTAGPTDCTPGLECRGGTCESCTPAAIALSGGFPMPSGMDVVRQVTASGSSITFADDATSMSGTVMLGTGVTASGSFTTTCGTLCDWLTSVTASGSTLTLTSAGVGGGTPTTGTITLTGATVTGSAVASEITAALPGYFATITVSGDTMTLIDQASMSSTIRFVPTTAGCP